MSVFDNIRKDIRMLKLDVERLQKQNENLKMDIAELKNPVIIEPFNEVKVKIIDRYITVHTECEIRREYRDEPIITEGVAKVLSSDMDKRGNYYYNERDERLYKFLLKDKTGKETMITLWQDEFKESIENAKS